ncbi:RNA polymerase sigma factor [Pedobacter sp. MC2016-24]|uniref:RNA polymerase sigma factor n=1 Tax=Pedobacter sp. MC2016-24 TaxID=2780090 RepID=UPI0018822321|nr:RNA polymerase sigma factor [Pedobacter sp. MC2016-24]MBE9601350.1 RNA polymerase sigma factor [Pedobacter sp. MC2016-24]
MESTGKNDISSLLARIAMGDEAAFSHFFDLYRPNIYTTVLRITKDEWLSEEILQDTFVKTWISREALTGIENIENWLYKIARNVTYTAMKRSFREKQNFNQMTKASISLFYPETDYLERDEQFHSLLETAISRLPRKQQETFRLIKQSGLKREQVAAKLEVSAETVKWNLDQAMRSVRAYCTAHVKDLPLIFVLHFFSKYF